MTDQDIEAIRRHAETMVTMDPRVELGRPILKVSAVPTAVIADRYKAGESIAALADDYGGSC